MPLHLPPANKYPESWRLLPILTLPLPILILFASLLIPSRVQAADGVKFEPGSLAFTIQSGDSLTLYTTLTTPADMTNLVIENNGLVNGDKTANIPPDKVLIAPASGDIPAGQQRFAVTIQQPEKLGHYTGELVLRYTITDTFQTLPLVLEVTVNAKPNVAAGSTSDNQTLVLRPNLLYLGMGHSWTTSIPQGQIVITLEQTGQGEATITGVKIDALRRASQPLLGDTLAVTPPVTASETQTTEAGTLDLAVQANSGEIPPGEYQSGMRLTVKGQDTPVVVTFKVQSKAGPLWPFLIALAGIGFGYLSYWLNKRVNPLSKLVEKVKEIEAIETDPQALQADDRENFSRTLKAIQMRMMAGEDPSALETSLDELIAQIKAKREENRKFLSPEGDLGKAIAEMQALEVGDTVRDEIVQVLNKNIGERLERGGFRNMDKAKDELVATERQREKLKDVNKAFLEVKALADDEKEAGTTPKVDIADLKVKLNQAKNDFALDNLVAAALAKYKPPQPEEEAAFGIPGAELMEALRERVRGAKDERAQWDAFTARLKRQRLMGVLVVAFFALLGGVIALYIPNATWGASCNDYITFFVWALSVNIIAGQTVDFKAQLTPPVQA